MIQIEGLDAIADGFSRRPRAGASSASALSGMTEATSKGRPSVRISYAS